MYQENATHKNLMTEAKSWEVIKSDNPATAGGWVANLLSQSPGFLR